MNFITLFLHLTVGVGVLVALFAVQAVITLWESGAWGSRALRRGMIPMGRNAIHTMCSWKHAIYLFYLGTATSWTSSKESLGQPVDTVKIVSADYPSRSTPGEAPLRSLPPVHPPIAAGTLGTPSGMGELEAGLLSDPLTPPVRVGQRMAGVLS